VGHIAILKEERKLIMFTKEEVRIANSTSRSNGASARNKDGSIRAIVPKWVAAFVSKKVSILDFGAGKDAVHTKWLREQGFNVTAYDFGDNCIEGLHDKDALNKKYQIIMASNVINVSSSYDMLIGTLRQMYNSLESGGTLIMNYPAAPRKMDLTARELEKIIESVFGAEVVQDGGTSAAPLWTVKKPYLN
jgi:hypothetical protein